MKYIDMLQNWISKRRSFRDEFLIGLGILTVLLLLMKILGRLIVGQTFLGFGRILVVLVIYVIITYVIRTVEMIKHK